MAEMLEDGVKLSNEEGALMASALSAALCMLLMHVEYSYQMLENVRMALKPFGQDGLNNLQARLGECAERKGAKINHVTAHQLYDERWEPPTFKRKDPPVS